MQNSTIIPSLPIIFLTKHSDVGSNYRKTDGCDQLARTIFRKRRATSFVEREAAVPEVHLEVLARSTTMNYGAKEIHKSCKLDDHWGGGAIELEVLQNSGEGVFNTRSPTGLMLII